MKRLHVLLLAVFCVVGAVASVAFAEVTTVTPPSGGSPGSPGSTGSDPTVSWACVGEALYRNGLLASEKVPVCPLGTTDWAWSGEYVNCTVGYEVWRFYGTETAPTVSASLSRVDIADPCNPGPELLLFFPHPDDSSLGTPATAPFRTGTSDSAIYTSREPHTTSLGGVTYATTSPPVALSATRCDSFIPANGGIHDFFRDSAGTEGARYDDLEAAQIRDIFFGEYQDRVAAASVSYARSSLDVADVVNDELWLANSTLCDSDVDFSTRDGAQIRAMSTCWVPVSRELRVYNSPTSPSPIYAANFFRTERYGLPADPAVTTRSLDATRSRLLNSVLNRHSSIATPAASPTATAAGFTAAEQVAFSAECASTTGANVSSVSSTATSTVRPDRAVVTVDLPAVGQTGGELRPSRLEFGAPVLECGLASCPVAGPTAPRVTGTNSVVVTLEHPTAYEPTSFYDDLPATGIPSEAFAGFFQPTAPGETFGISLTGTVEVRGDVATSVEVTLANPLGGGTSTGISIDTTTPVLWDVPVVVEFTGSATFPVVGAASAVHVAR